MRSLPFLLLLLCANIYAQQHPCAAAKTRQFATQLAHAVHKPSALTAHEHKYDMKFVHLDLEISDTTKFISGNSTMIARVSAAALDTYVVLLHQNLTIDSIHFNGVNVPFLRHDSAVKVTPSVPLPNNSTFTAQVWYAGLPPSGGSAIGDGFSNAVDWSANQPVTWSLSQPLVAYHWWPAKQVLTDKIDSSWVFVSTDSSNMAGSNGLLVNVTDLGAKKRFEWKSRYPIDYYLISVAVSDYKEYNLYAKPLYLNDSILIQNFIYSNLINTNYWNSAEKPQIDKMPAMIELFSRLYGMYPFHKEKYGHCMAAIGGGMEHQTMSTMGGMGYLPLNAHELGHQWWGDNVTCKSWSDIFMNEGFAHYSVLVALEHLSNPTTLQSNLNSMHNNVMSKPGGSIHFTGADTLNTTRIFDGRLSYDKGAAILHTLRFVTNNDSLWFNTLRDFQYTHTGKTVGVTDFMNFYHSSTGIDPAVFFNQWYYGEGYPTFTAKYNYDNTQVFLEVQQTTSMPSKTPLFVTPLEYRIFRQGMPDTTVRLIHAQPVDTFTLPIAGKIITVLMDEKNWVINKLVPVVRDITLGVTSPDETEKISVRPNPSGGNFDIVNPGNLPGEYTVRDVTGRILLRGDFPARSIELGNHAPGIYFLTIRTGENVRSVKLIRD